MQATQTSPAPTPLARLGWVVFVLVVCAHFTLLDLWRSPQFLDLVRYAAFQERLPYQGRVLMAAILHLTAGSTRVAPLLSRIASHAPRELQNPYVFVLLFTTFAGLFVAVLAARATLLHLTGSRQFASWFALLTLYMAYFNLLAPYGGLTYTLPYDVPALAFFSVGVWLVLTGRYWLLLPVFLLGTLNRETFCYITIFLALYAWFGAGLGAKAAMPQRDAQNQTPPLASMRRVWLHIVLQAVVWVSVRLWAGHLLVHNATDAASNGIFELQFRHNLKMLFNPPQWPLFFSLFGFTLPLFFHGYRAIGDRPLARSIAVLLVLWTVPMLFIGVILELRIFNELTAVLAPAIALIVWNRWLHPEPR